MHPIPRGKYFLHSNIFEQLEKLMNLIFLSIVFSENVTISTENRVCHPRINCHKCRYLTYQNTSVEQLRHQFQTYVTIKKYDIFYWTIHIEGCISIYISSSLMWWISFSPFCLRCETRLSACMTQSALIVRILTVAAWNPVINKIIKHHS